VTKADVVEVSVRIVGSVLLVLEEKEEFTYLGAIESQYFLNFM